MKERKKNAGQVSTCIKNCAGVRTDRGWGDVQVSCPNYGLLGVKLSDVVREVLVPLFFGIERLP